MFIVDDPEFGAGASAFFLFAIGINVDLGGWMLGYNKASLDRTRSSRSEIAIFKPSIFTSKNISEFLVVSKITFIIGFVPSPLISTFCKLYLRLSSEYTYTSFSISSNYFVTNFLSHPKRLNIPFYMDIPSSSDFTIFVANKVFMTRSIFMPPFSKSKSRFNWSINITARGISFSVTHKIILSINTIVYKG